MVLELVERLWFSLCRALGRVLRSGRYSDTRIARQGSELQVLKRRRSYAPLLVSLGGPLMRVLDTGVRVLPQRNWEQRERILYRELHGVSIRTGTRGVLELPHFPGRTLAKLLEDPTAGEATRLEAMELAALALADFHRRGLTHGDAMAENVMVGLGEKVAHWFDFETVHDSSRPLAWRRADDVRALLSTCLVRTSPDERSAALRVLLDAYGDSFVTRHLADAFGSVVTRPLAFHLGQAPMPLRLYREIAHLLRACVGANPGDAALVDGERNASRQHENA